MSPLSYMSTKTLMTASWKLPSSPSGAPGAPDMVKALRDQSQEAPRRLSWLMMVPPDWVFHSQTFSRNFSRPISRRDSLPSSARRRSTTIWVAMPAWSWPGCQSVSWPRIRCQRVRISCNVLLKACPMWSEPVTLGGGIMIEKVSAPSAALAPALKAPEFSQAS